MVTACLTRASAIHRQIRLKHYDEVFSTGGIIQYAFGKTIQNGYLSKSPSVPTATIAELQSRHERQQGMILEYLQKI